MRPTGGRAILVRAESISVVLAPSGLDQPYGPAYVDDADDHGRLTRPLLAANGRVDRPAVIADPTQARAPRVALADRVSRDQAKRSSLAKQVERAAEEVRDKVRVAVRFLVDRP